MARQAKPQIYILYIYIFMHIYRYTYTRIFISPFAVFIAPLLYTIHHLVIGSAFGFLYDGCNWLPRVNCFPKAVSETKLRMTLAYDLRFVLPYTVSDRRQSFKCI